MSDGFQSGLPHEATTRGSNVEKVRSEVLGMVSIIIPVFNQLSCTERCLEAIFRNTPEPFELVVYDNASTDGTGSYLASIKNIKYIRGTQNIGFPASVNKAFLETEGEFLLLLNNDVVVTAGWLNRLLSAINLTPRIGLAGPSSNSVSGFQQIRTDYASDSEMEKFAALWAHRHAGIVERVGRLVGFCLLIRRSVIDSIGMFDEAFGLGNFEDDDFCLRASLAGFHAVIARDAFVHHDGSATFRNSNIDVEKLIRKNFNLFVQKWGERMKLLALPPERVSPVPSSEQSEPAELIRSNTKPRPRISLCMIVRDSSHVLGAALRSIKPWVDEMIVVDTGSTDRTYELAEELGADVSRFPWCDDFSAARNESIRRANGDWIFWMDSDDVIDAVNGSKLRSAVEAVGDPLVLGLIAKVRCPGSAIEEDFTAVDHVKIFRNRADLRFEGRIHEQILPSIRRSSGEVNFTDIFVVHSGSDQSPSGKRKKYDRDLRLLKLEDAERPNHPFTLFNLGMTYSEMGEYHAAISCLQRSLLAAHPTESHVCKLYALLAGSLSNAGQIDEAVRICGEGLMFFPSDPELLFRRAILLQNVGRLLEAEADYLSALDRAGGLRFSSVDSGISGYKAWNNLASIYLSMNRLSEAEEACRKAIEGSPSFCTPHELLHECLLRRGRWSEAGTVLNSMRGNRRLFAAVSRIECNLARSRGDINTAIRHVKAAVEVDAGDLNSQMVLGQLLYQNESFEDAAAHLARAAVIHPADATLHYNLALSYSRLGKLKEAIRCCEISLAHRPNYGLAAQLLRACELSIDSDRSVIPRGVEGEANPLGKPADLE